MDLEDLEGLIESTFNASGGKGLRGVGQKAEVNEEGLGGMLVPMRKS